ncbi:MAG: hypothetical protein U9Q69_00210 [Nanoarchaeota archaeon]|nr:hypothetical protein [Nanoarchaeota archaeon]
MNEIIIEIDKKKHDFLIPEKWSELSEEQFIFISQFVANLSVENIDIIINYFLQRKNIPLFDFPKELYKLITDIIISKPTSKWFIKKYKNLHGPADAFRNVTIAEFAFADTYFLRYEQKPKAEYLHKFIASLYREGKENFNKHEENDIRIEFNENKLDFLAEKVSNWRGDVKYAILSNFKLMRAVLKSLYPHLFDEKTADEKKIISKTKNIGGWDKIIRGFCEGDLTKIDKVKNLLIHTIFAEMNDNILKDKKK